MLFFALSFLLGDCLLQLQTQLPSPILLEAGTIAAIVLIMKRSHWVYLSACAFGFVWAGWSAHHMMSWQLPLEAKNKPLLLRGCIASLPVKSKFGTHFIFRLDESADILLSWRQPPALHAGDCYELNVRIKRIHALRNPGGFDYEAYAFQNALRASGSIVEKMPQRFIRHDDFVAPIHQLRQHFQEKLQTQMPVSETAVWLMALMIGERSGAPSQHWQILRATGTNHLMAVAGLHIGMISGIVYFVVLFLWRRAARITLHYPSQLAASFAALLSVWMYSALAGFSIPTQRACSMATLFILASLLRRQIPVWHAWAVSIIIVLLFNPHSVLSESFWLSFGTIALIIYGMSGRLSPSGIWWHWCRVQWVIGFGLLPLSLLFFQQTSLISVAANSIAIPWLGFFILPLTWISSLLIWISPSLGAFVLYLADKSLAGLWLFLKWVASFDFAVWTQPMPSMIVLILTIAGCVLLLLPSGMPGRWIGLLWLLPIIIWRTTPVSDGAFKMSVLDVGQGLSVVIQTKQHTLLYDAGPRFGDQFDAGESVVLPYLFHQGIRELDVMMISHGDNDHIGGSFAVMQQYPATKILTSAVEKFSNVQASYCLAGQHWQWDGVDFTVIYPDAESLKHGNDSSCVLKIENQRHRVLLTGDIEKFAERNLLAGNVNRLQADVMTAPHHGSKTSSTLPFVRAVMPQYVLFATGYHNRYRFPHVPVVKRYDAENMMTLNTTDTGAVTFVFDDKAEIKPNLYRFSHLRYWSDA